MKKGRLITIGSFDGVHKGHCELLDRTVHEGKKRHLPSLALTFSLPPRLVLNKVQSPSLLTTEIEKEYWIKSRGINEVEFLEFNKNFSKIRPFSFFRDLLLNKFQAKGIVVGFDFRFGEDRSAGVHELVRWGLDFEIPVWVIPQIKAKREIISSTRIRELLEKGNFQKVVSLIGHPDSVAGKIVKGRGVGKKIGFPTTNIQVDPRKLLPRGVFVVRGTILNSRSAQSMMGVCNIGLRPTFLKNSPLTVEVHWLNGRLH